MNGLTTATTNKENTNIATPNFSDNLPILRGMDSETVGLAAADPLFNIESENARIAASRTRDAHAP